MEGVAGEGRGEEEGYGDTEDREKNEEFESAASPAAEAGRLGGIRAHRNLPRGSFSVGTEACYARYATFQTLGDRPPAVQGQYSSDLGAGKRQDGAGDRRSL